MPASRRRRLSRTIALLLLLVTSTVLFFPAGEASGGPPSLHVGEDAQPIANWADDQVHPSVAYGAWADVHLVVWEDHSLSGRLGRRIVGRRVGTQGAPSGDPFVISGDPPNHRLVPDVAYSSISREFYVVYEYEYSAADHDIYARRVGSDGSLIGGEIAISTMSSYESNPRVIHNWVDNQYLVVWEVRVGSDEFYHREIIGRRLDGNGIPLGGQFMINTGSLDRLAPAVAYNGTNNNYLVVWQSKQAGGQFDIHGQRVAANGSLLGSVITISSWEYDQIKPRVAYNGLNNEFLVVWEDHHWGWGADWDIYGQRIHGNGTLLGGNFGISWEGERHRLSPAVAYKPGANEYLVVWELEWTPGDHDVYRRRIGADGTLLESEAAVSNLGSYEAGPAVAADYAGRYLVVWEDQRNAATQGIDVYAAAAQIPATPTPTHTATRTFTTTPTPTHTFTPTCTLTQTATRTATQTFSPTPSATATPTTTATATATRTGTTTATPSATATPTSSATATPSPTSSVTVTSTPTATATATASQTSSATATSPPHTPTATATPSASATPTVTGMATQTATATPTASLTVTATPTATGTHTTGTLRGRIILERRASNAGVIVEVAGRVVATTTSGEYVLVDIPVGQHIMLIHRQSYLRTERVLVVVAGQALTLPDVTLLGGDVNQDGRIGLADADLIGQAWNSTPSSVMWDERADITDDGVINVLDMVAVQFNWGRITPGP